MINFQTLDQTAYENLRFQIISKGEGFVLPAYLDTQGIPTIGIGFNLRDDNILLAVLNSFGMQLTTRSKIFTDFRDLAAATYTDNTAMRTALDKEIQRLHDLDPPHADRITFAYKTNDEMRPTYNLMIPEYDNPNEPLQPGRVDKWLAGIPQVPADKRYRSRFLSSELR